MTQTKFDLKFLINYFKASQELSVLSPIAQYYTKYYTIKKAMEMIKLDETDGVDTTDSKKALDEWVKELKTLNTELAEFIADKETCKKEYYDFTLKLFKKADDKYRNNEFSEQVAKEFFWATVLFDAYVTLDPNDTSFAKLQKYAKVSRVKIMKALQSGQVPVPIETKKEEVKENKFDDNMFSNIAAPEKPSNNVEFKNSSNYAPPSYTMPTNNQNTFGNTSQKPYQIPDSFETKKPEYQIPKNDHNQTPGFGSSNTTPTPQNNFSNDQNSYSNTTPTGGASLEKKTEKKKLSPEFFQKTETAKEMCRRAISELDYKRIKQSKENLLQALALLEQLEKMQ